MGASENILMQTVWGGFLVCLIGAVICAIVVQIHKRIVKEEPEEEKENTPVKYQIGLSNRQTGDDYTASFDKEVIVGRSPEMANLIVYDDRSVSKKHFKITVESGKFMIEDLQSSNHTWLNGRKITEKESIHSGDLVTVGYYTYSVRLGKENE